MSTDNDSRSIFVESGIRVEKIGGNVYVVRRLERGTWRRVGAVCADSLREAAAAARDMLASDDV